MSVFPKMILWLNEMPMKSPNDFCFILCFFLVNTEKLTLKHKYKGTITRTAKIILKKEKKWEILLYLMKRYVVYHTNRYTDEWIRTELRNRP